MGPKNKPTTRARYQDQNEDMQSLVRPFSGFRLFPKIMDHVCYSKLFQYLCTVGTCTPSKLVTGLIRELAFSKRN